MSLTFAVMPRSKVVPHLVREDGCVEGQRGGGHLVDAPGRGRVAHHRNSRITYRAGCVGDGE